MNDCILVQARTGSQRLKNKILLKIQGKTILEILISRQKSTYKELLGENLGNIMIDLAQELNLLD